MTYVHTREMLIEVNLAARFGTSVRVGSPFSSS